MCTFKAHIIPLQREAVVQRTHFSDRAVTVTEPVEEPNLQLPTGSAGVVQKVIDKFVAQIRCLVELNKCCVLLPKRKMPLANHAPQHSRLRSKIRTRLCLSLLKS
eukprot:9244392-Pyramimonas_sp.AAC.1